MYEREAGLPPRPAVPLALWSLATSCASMSAVMGLAFERGAAWLAVVLGSAAGVACCSIGGFVVATRQRRVELASTVLALGLVTALSLVAGCLCASRQLHAMRRLSSSAPSSWTLRVISDATQTDYGLRCRATASIGGRVVGDVWLTGPSLARLGSTIACVGRFAPLASDAYGLSSWQQGVCGRVSVVRILWEDAPTGAYGCLLALRGRLIEALEPERGAGRALVAGCLCGSRDALAARGITDTFAACGIAHLIAVSGAHLTLVASLLSLLLSATSLMPKARVCVLVLSTGAFVAFCGAPVSAVRAWLMLLVAFGSQLAGRKAHSLSSVSLAAMVMALVRPSVVGELGFRLSVVSVVGLTLLSAHAGYVIHQLLGEPHVPGALGYKAQRLAHKAHDGVCAGLAVSLVCQLVTLPLTCAAFGRLSLVAPLVNLVATPLLGLLMCLGLVGCALSWMTPAREAVLDACDGAASPILGLLELVARTPFASVPTGQMAGIVFWLAPALVALWVLLWPRVSRRGLRRALGAAALAIGFVLCRWRFFAPARIVVLDVGQGDAILVQDGASAILVDAGPDDAVVEALARRHVLHLDAVVITHLHDDHCGGLDDLVGALGCEQVLVARGVAERVPDEVLDASLGLTGRTPQELSYGDVVQAGGFALRMVWPREAVDGDENGESIELVVSYDVRGERLSALLTGDAERDETGSCVAAGDVGDIDLLKIGHHGSEVSLDEGVASALACEVAVASVGEANAYGHPRPECVQMLEDAWAVVLCTKDVGDVEVRPGREGPVVHAYGSAAG